MDLIALIENPELMNRTTLAELQALVDEFPCMQAARLLLVENAFRLGEPLYRSEAEKAAALVPDRKVLFELTEGVHFQQQDEPNEQTTIEATDTRTGTDLTATMIDRFLFGNSEEQEKKEKAVDPASDYMGYLFQIEGQTGTPCPALHAPTPAEKIENDPTLKVLEAAKVHGKKWFKPASRREDETEGAPHEWLTPDTAEEGFDAKSCYTETLANICLKQGRYERAAEILTYLHLNNPKKSAYFADKIRFIRKLAINSKYNS